MLEGLITAREQELVVREPSSWDLHGWGTAEGNLINVQSFRLVRAVNLRELLGEAQHNETKKHHASEEDGEFEQQYQFELYLEGILRQALDELKKSSIYTQNW
ncbi:MAG: hypothetical protein Q9159_001059 [Coniocarpon cinnabarinum]